MAEYLLPDSPAWDDVYAAQNGDGTGTFWANSFLPLWGRLSALSEFLDYDATKLGTTLTTSDLEMEADVVIEGPGKGFVVRNPASLADGNVTVNMAFNVYIVASLTADRTYVLPDPDRAGRTVTIVKRNNSAFDATINRDDASTICVFDVSGATMFGSATFVSREQSAGVYRWGLMSWSGSVSPSNDTL